VDEAERSIHDAIMVTKDVIEKPAVVVGGGAAEVEVAHQVLKWAETLSGREQLAAQKFAEALESLAITLAENAGMDPIDVQVELRAKHAEGQKWFGVDVKEGKLADMYNKEVFDPLVVKEQIIKAATDAASMILRVDDVIAAGKMKETKPPKPGEEGGGGEE
jgi:chaperonin GroEL (HSP60 family)